MKRAEIWQQIIGCLITQPMGVAVWEALGGLSPTEEPYHRLYTLAVRRKPREEIEAWAFQAGEQAEEALKLCIGRASTITALSSLAEQLAGLELARSLESVGAIATNTSTPARERAVEIVRMLTSSLRVGRSRGAVSAQEAANRLLSSTGKQLTIKSSMPSINSAMLGWARGGLHIVAARPGRGKTWVLLKEGLHLAQAGLPGLIVSAEMSVESVATRMVTMLSGVEPMRIRAANFGLATLSADESLHIKQAVEAFARLPIHIVDSTSDVELVEAHVLSALERKIQWVLVDYLQLIHSSVLGRAAAKKDTVSYTSNRLTMLAREHNLAIIAACQLRRPENPTNEDNAPTLSMLKESGDIEQDATSVLALSRLSQRPNDNSWLMRAEILKAREGITTTFNIRLNIAKGIIQEERA